MDRGAWWARVHGVAKKSDTTEQINNHNKIILAMCYIICMTSWGQYNTEQRGLDSRLMIKIK